MTQKELRRGEVMAQLEVGKLKTREASQLLGLSERQVKRRKSASAGVFAKMGTRYPFVR